MNGSCLPMMWPQAKRSVLVVVSILAWSCSLADHAHDCTKGSDDEADLCWARQAEAQLDDDPASAMETAERIADLRLHDITMLMIQRKLKDPRARVDSCKKLRDERAQQRCMTYEVRPHLRTKLTDQSERDPAEATPERVNSPSCVKLPVEWRDACELEGVLSRAMSSAGESFSGDRAGESETEDFP